MRDLPYRPGPHSSRTFMAGTATGLRTRQFSYSFLRPVATPSWNLSSRGPRDGKARGTVEPEQEHASKCSAKRVDTAFESSPEVEDQEGAGWS